MLSICVLFAPSMYTTHMYRENNDETITHCNCYEYCQKHQEMQKLECRVEVMPCAVLLLL